MEALVSIFIQFLTGGYNIVMGVSTPGMHPNMVWVLVIGFVAIAVTLALQIDSK